MYIKHQALRARRHLSKLVAVFVMIALLLPATRALSQTPPPHLCGR